MVENHLDRANLIVRRDLFLGGIMRALLLASLLFSASATAQTVNLPYSLELEGLHRMADRCADTATEGCAAVERQLIAVYGSPAAYQAALAPLTDETRATLHRQAAACDAGQETRTVCAPIYIRLVRHYRSYLAYIDATQAWKSQ